MGNKLTLEEQIKANKRLITRSIRELDRERTQLERDQKKLEMEIKKLGKSIIRVQNVEKLTSTCIYIYIYI